MDVRLVGAGDRQADRFGSCCKQQAVVRDLGPVGERHVPRPSVYARDVRVEL